MRVIAGSARGRRLAAPRGLAVRPTADRVRQSIFDMLSVRWADGRVLDLFAGSGALGIEALSRGATAAVFVERDPAAVRMVEENVTACGFGERASIVRADFRSALRRLARAGERFDLVFIDPPYAGSVRDAAITEVGAVLAPNALVVVETAATEPSIEPPASWGLEAERKYGRTLVFLYRYG